MVLSVLQSLESLRKLYRWHVPELVCISKGKSRNCYELGVKVALHDAQRQFDLVMHGVFVIRIALKTLGTHDRALSQPDTRFGRQAQGGARLHPLVAADDRQARPAGPFCFACCIRAILQNWLKSSAATG